MVKPTPALGTTGLPRADRPVGGFPPPAPAPADDPLLQTLMAEHPSGAPLWVFAYGSLIWRPEVAVAERRPATTPGWHRAFRMHSHLYRGTSERPGLVFALMPGGCCHGVALRLQPARAEADLHQLWAREMPSHVYRPRWLKCHTTQGPVRALGFTLDRHSHSHAGRLDDARVLEILRHAEGRMGSTLDYLVQTDAALRRHGIRDGEAGRLLALARRHGLLPAGD